MQFESYGREDGLTSSAIEAIYQDKRGYIWVGSKNVMLRFDGLTFKSYESHQKGYSSQNVRHITEDHSGRLWYVAGGRLFLYDEINETFNEYVPVGEGHHKDLSAYSEFIYKIIPSEDDNLTLLTREGVVLVNTTEHSWKPGSVEDEFIGYTKTSDGQFWVWQGYYGASLLDDNFNMAQRFAAESDTSRGLPRHVTAVFEAQDNTTWIIGSDIVYATPEDLKERRFTSLLGDDYTNKGIFTHFVFDRDGNFWVDKSGWGCPQRRIQLYL